MQKIILPLLLTSIIIESFASVPVVNTYGSCVLPVRMSQALERRSYRACTIVMQGKEATRSANFCVEEKSATGEYIGPTHPENFTNGIFAENSEENETYRGQVEVCLKEGVKIGTSWDWTPSIPFYNEGGGHSNLGKKIKYCKSKERFDITINVSKNTGQPNVEASSRIENLFYKKRSAIRSEVKCTDKSVSDYILELYNGLLVTYEKHIYIMKYESGVADLVSPFNGSKTTVYAADRDDGFVKKLSDVTIPRTAATSRNMANFLGRFECVGNQVKKIRIEPTYPKFLDTGDALFLYHRGSFRIARLSRQDLTDSGIDPDLIAAERAHNLKRIAKVEPVPGSAPIGQFNRFPYIYMPKGIEYTEGVSQFYLLRETGERSYKEIVSTAFKLVKSSFDGGVERKGIEFDQKNLCFLR